MALVADDSPSHPTHLPSDSPTHLPSDSIPLIDLRFFSQSELAALSLCSDKAFDLRSCGDVIIPKIDRSVFNESAGSRKQTYSRLRLAPRKPEISAVGRGRYNPVPKPHSNPVDDPERKENKEIVSILRGLFGKDSEIQFKKPEDHNQNLDIIEINTQQLVENNNYNPSVLTTAQPQPQPIAVAEGGIVKRKRGRPRKDGRDLEITIPGAPKPKVRKESHDYYENVAKEENVVMEIVNKNGVVVDLAVLACSEDPYGPELRDRTAGLASEEELLTFMRELKGQWGSRRKKRKVVDACDFGDALPVGWKLLLSLRRKEGRLSLYCRRYISPTGQQFLSCKEVSSYLLPFFGFQSENPNPFESDESNDEAYKLSSGSSAGLGLRDGSTKDEFMYHEASPLESFSSGHEKEIDLLGTENLAEVEVRDLLECHICKKNFDEKDVYLQHLLSSHQRSAKRVRSSGTSVCDGVIINDGKFECQFCHKIFDERHRYNGHVGVHVRNHVRGIELPSGGTTLQDNVKPSSMNGVVSGIPVVETSTDADKVDLPPVSVPSNETAMQDKVISSSGSGVLPESSGVMVSVDVVKSSDPLPFIPSDENNIKDCSKPSHVSEMLPGSPSVQAPDKDFGHPTSIHEGEAATQDIKLSSGSRVHSEIPEVGELADINKGAISSTAVPGTEINVDPSCGKLDMDVSISKPANEQNPPHSEPNTGVNIAKSFIANPEVADGDSLHDNLGSGPSVEHSTSVSNSELHVGSPGSKQDMAANDIESMSAGSGDKQESDVEIADDTLGSIGNITTSVDFSSCLDSAASLFDAVEDCNNETMQGKDVFTSTTDGKLHDVSQPNDVRDSDINSCLGPVNVSIHDDVENGNVPTSSTVGIDMFGVKQGNSSFAIAYTSSGNEQTAVETLQDKDTTGTADGKTDQDTSDLGRNFNAASCDNLENDNVPTSSTAGINMFDVNPGESSFGIAFASSCNEETNVVETLQGKDVTKTNDAKADQATDDLDGDFSSCLGSAKNASCDNLENGRVPTSSAAGINMFGLKQGESSFNIAFASSCSEKMNDVETFQGKGITSKTDSKVVQGTDDIDGDFSSCLGSANVTCDNLEKSNVPINSTVGINMFGHKQGESSFGFAFASSRSQKTNAFESFRRRDVTNTTDGKLDQAPNNLDGDFRSSFGAVNAASRDNGENGNVTTPSSTVGINVFGLKQGESSYGFAFPSPCSEKTNAVDFRGNDFTSTTDGKVDQIANDLNGDFKSCFGTAANMRTNMENDNIYERNAVFSGTALRTTTSGLKQGEGSFSFSFAPSGREKINDAGNFKGKDVFTSIPDRKWAAVDQTNNYVDGGFRSCLESAMRDDDEDGTSVTCEDNNIFTSNTVGTNMSSLKQGEHSFSFLFPPSGNERNNGIGNFGSKGVFAGTSNVKSAKVHHSKNDLDGDFGSYLEPATAFRDNLGSGANLPYGGNNAFTSTMGSSMSGSKQGERSLSFSFAPLGSGKTNGVEFGTDGLFSTGIKKPEFDRHREYGFIEQERCFGTSTSQPNKDVLIDSAGKETMLQRLGTDTPSPMLQSSGCFPTLDLMSLMSNKEQVESQNFPLQKYDNMSGFEELGFDDLEPSKFGFVTGEPNSLSQGHMDLGYDSVMEEALNNSVQFDWEPMAPKIDTGSTQQQSTLCVWCRMPFNHEAINSEMQSDSVGFMCPTCKAKISGQLSIGSSFNWL